MYLAFSIEISLKCLFHDAEVKYKGPLSRMDSNASYLRLQAKAAEAQVAKLDAERAPLLARLKELEEIQKVKRAAVQKEAHPKKESRMIRGSIMMGLNCVIV